MKTSQSLAAIRSEIKAGNLTMVQIVNEYLNNIEFTKELNLYVEVYRDEVLEKAEALDLKIKKSPNSLGKAWGMVVSLKDVIAYKGHKMTAGSKILKDYVAPYHSTVAERLVNEDAIIIGRVNCDEFAMGSSNERSVYGVSCNALNKELVPGGSSGASASSVQADTCLISLGSDTGGSVRQPASFCGVTGVKPSYGRISRHGLIAYASSFDQIGVLGHQVEDISIALEVISGSDEYDVTASKREVPAYSQPLESGNKKIAIFKSAIENEGIDPEIKEETLKFIEKLKSQGHQIELLDFEYFDYVIPAYYVMTTAEASSNLARFDGIRYGHRTETSGSLTEMYANSRTEGFGEEVQARILLGTYVLSAGYYDSYFGKAQKIRRIIRDRLIDVLNDFDFIGLPTSPMPAWKIGSIVDDPVQNYLADIYTVLANLAGLPAASIPLKNHSNGSGIGFQVMAGKFKEHELLSFLGTI